MGNGNDTVDGVGANDTYDVASAKAAVTVDLRAGTSTGGSGTDTLKHIDDVMRFGLRRLPSPVARAITSSTAKAATTRCPAEPATTTVLIPSTAAAASTPWTTARTRWARRSTWPMHGEQLRSTVHRRSAATAAWVGSVARTAPEHTVENAILGTGNDIFTGSAFNNTVWPNGGQNSLNGCPRRGARVAASTPSTTATGYNAGVTVNLAGGGPTSGNADSIVGFTNAVGTAFADNIIGTDAQRRELVEGRQGQRQLSGNNGPDFVLGGAGNDAIRGGAGDDTLKGQGGKDNIRGSGGDDNIFGGKGKDYCDGGGGNDSSRPARSPRTSRQRSERPRPAPEDLKNQR